MTPLTKAIIAAFLAMVVLLGVQTCRTVSLERKLTAAQLAPAKQAVAIAQARVETVTVRLAAAERIVTRVLRQVRTDTLMLRPQTAQDTAKALAELPVLAAAHDSLKASCSAFVVSCADYRTTAEARFTADSVYRVGLEAALRGAAPSRLGAVWSKTKVPIALAAGLYVGLRVR